MHIDNLIHLFSQKNLIQFLRQKIKTFKPDSDDLSYLFKDEVFEKYEFIEKIGEATLNGDDLIIITSKTTDPLTEKSGKKNQFEIAKKILKEEVKDAAIFVFYDEEGNFRFSFVNANYLGTKRNYSDFKRYTYFVNKDKQNNTFKRQVGDCSFNSLEDIIKAFSVEPLNKQFYQEISKAFYALIGGKINIASRRYDFEPVLELPSTPHSDRKRYQEFAVRLIGRTIFCWFLKNKKSNNKLPLIPENWLQSETVEMLNNGGYNYYHDYLEKLFFLILNKKLKNRADYDLPDGHETIPFLNGGLFEAHSDDFFPKDSIGIHKVSYNLKIPNDWFFELFKVLEQFNFTIDENSINDAEVSIDPEMLGTIFENLLAEIDPDTEKSARKSTGSFYTPREIVDYMVEQSIIQYLKTKTSVTNEVSLQNLFKEGGENEYEEKQTIEILEALNTVKILDPACGSGAYPMGALHKIITILHKLDPDASWWKEKQINSNKNAIIRKAVREELNNKNADYIRKLGIIQNSIYGVDIQPIATEIAKLRSFLSLIIDENIIDDAENRGIEPLPNLEFKFVTANTLIGLPKEGGQQGIFNNFEELELLEELRTNYLQSSGKKKNKIKERFLRVQKKAFSSKNNLFLNPDSRAYKIMSWNPFKDNTSDWFDSEWMFGVDKFNIILGNPPYIGHKGGQKQLFRKLKTTALGKSFNNERMDIFYYFFHKAINNCFEEGVIAFITTNYYLTADSAVKLRKDFFKRAKPIKLINFNEFKIFESAVGQHNIITILNKTKKNNICEIINVNRTGFAKGNQLNSILHGTDEKTKYYKESDSKLFDGVNHYLRIINSDSSVVKVNEVLDLKIKANNVLLSEICNISQGIVTGIDKISPKHIKKHEEYTNQKDSGVFVISEEERKETFENNLLKPWYKNSDINKYTVREINTKWLIHTSVNIDLSNFPNIEKHLMSFKNVIEERNYDSGELRKAKKLNKWYALSSSRRDFNFDLPKIVSPQRSYSNTFAYTNKEWYASADVYFITKKDNKISLKFILAILNSKLIYFWLYHRGKRKGKMLELYLTPLSEIPIAIPNQNIQNKIIKIVNDIIENRKIDSELDLSKIEFELNLFIYKIYDLNFNEVLLIDKEFKLTKEQYENYCITDD